MVDEFQALIDNVTWWLIPRPPGANVVMGKWTFKHNSDDTLACQKARWVVQGFSQQHDVDYDETFSLIVNPTTIHIVFIIDASRAWPFH